MPRSFKSSAWMICTLFLLTFTTAAVPASADVLLISVNKSTQQMSVSVDGVPRYRFMVSTGRAGYVHRMVPTVLSAFGSLLVFQTVLQFGYASFDFFTAVMQFTAAMRSTDLVDQPHMAASACTPPTPQLFSNW